MYKALFASFHIKEQIQMTAKMNFNLDLRNVQEQVDANIKEVSHLSHKAILTYAGLWGLAYDKTQSIFGDSKALFDKAEKRGEELESEWMTELKKLRKNPSVEKYPDMVEERVADVSKVAKNLQSDVKEFVGRYVNPNEAVASAENLKIEVEGAVTDAVAAVEKAVESMAEKLVAGYDNLAARDVVEHLKGMSRESLEILKEYEGKNKNRVTVLREIDTLLETPEAVA
jgi:hypothetical protein